MSLFEPVVAREEFGRQFREVAEGRQFAPARAIIDEVFERMGDRDGNFAVQFQTAGFDARLWELYLYSAFEEQGWEIDQTHPSPDFLLSDSRFAWGVEATTAAGSPGALEVGTEKDLLDFLAHELPIRLGSPLYSKMQRRYHEAPHMTDKPLVLALESFISDNGFFFSENTIADYLLGRRAVSERQPNGSLKVTFERIKEHRIGDKVIPSGFFEHAETEDIAAVMFSNAATISKFNRIGYRRQIPNEIVMMTRLGMAAVHDPNASEPVFFNYDVAERDETWSEGLVLIHNPQARRPLPESLLPGLAHYRLEGEQVVGQLPEFHAFSSRTLIVITRSERREGYR